MLAIRLRRIGKKSHPTYRIVVAEHTDAVQGNFVADLGFYNPHTKAVSLKTDEIVGWMNKGAKPSNTVAKVLEKEKVKHKSIVVLKYKKAPKKAVEEVKVKPSPAASEPVAETESSVEEVVEAPTEDSQSTEPIPATPTTEEPAPTDEPTKDEDEPAEPAETE